MTTAYALQALSASPRLYTIDGFLGDDEIEHVLRLADDPAKLAPGIETHQSQAGFSFEMPVGRDTVLAAIRQKITDVLGFGNDQDATFRFRRYAPGESHPQHTDAFAANGSELIVTAMIGLVAPEVGGETNFPMAEGGAIAVPPRRGRLVLWFNHTPDGKVDQQSAHSASQVLAGEKTTLTAFVYKPTYYAAAPFPAPPRETPTLRAVVLHAGRTAAATRAWVNAAAWVGFTVREHDTRSINDVPAADVCIPVDLSPAVRRALIGQYREGWTSVFTGQPRGCTDAALWLSRLGFPVRLAIPCASATEAMLAAAVDRVGGFPVEAWIGTWIQVSDMENLLRVASRASGLRLMPAVRTPVRDTDRRWIAVVNDRCIGPSAPSGGEEMAVRAIRALHARTGVVEYVVDDAGAAVIIGVNAPAEIAQLPMVWWPTFCLAVMEWHASDYTERASRNS